jgi:hypothetical protein
MAYAISLYDALVSINVPKSQALAVVESLEQTMTSELATKTDLEQLRVHTDREFASLRGDMAREFVSVRQEIQQLRGDMEREFIAVRREMAAESALLREEIKFAISRSVIMVTGLMMAWTSLLFAGLQFLG